MYIERGKNEVFAAKSGTLEFSVSKAIEEQLSQLKSSVRS